MTPRVLKTFINIPFDSTMITIEIYPKIYYLYSDLDLHNSVFDKRKDKNVEVITGHEVLRRIRPHLTSKQLVAIEKWLFERM